MAEEKTEIKQGEEKKEEKKGWKRAKEQEKEKKPEERKERLEENLIRILSTDIPGNKKIYPGLTRIKGISWPLSNALCISLRIDKNRRIDSLSKVEIEKIADFFDKLAKAEINFPVFLMNRRKDLDTGKNKHLLGTNLDLAKEFDIKRLKKMRCYKGVRHFLGQPVRGQRTKSHFRENRTVGVMKKAAKPTAVKTKGKEKK